MRNYIQTHIQPALDKARADIQALVDRLTKEETFNGSIVPGYTNKREALKNCVVFGEVQIEGSGTMANCLVLSGCTVHVGDGTMVTNSMFGTRSDTDTNSVHIGEHVMMNKVYTNIGLTVGDNSCIIETAFGNESTGAGPLQSIELGKNTVLIRTEVFINQQCGSVDSCMCKLGDGAIVVDGKLTTYSKNIDIGSSFLFCEYDRALDLCLGGSMIPTTEVSSPVDDLSRFRRDIQEGHRPHAIFYVPVKAGDGFYLGAGTRFATNDDVKSAGLTFGDNVFVLPGDSVWSQDDTRGYCTPCSICVYSLIIENNGTLVLDAPAGYESPQLKEIRIKEGSSLFLRSSDGSPSDRFTGACISINKNKVIEL